MASALYTNAKQLFLTAGIDWQSGGDDIRAILVDTDDDANAYTFSAAHTSLADVHADARVTAGKALILSSANGVADAADLTGGSTFSAVADPGSPANTDVNAIIIYKYNATESLAYLICYIDGVSVQPNGGDIDVTWHGSGIFSL